MPDLNLAYISIGSNISPAENITKALDHLRTRCVVLAVSKVWENFAVGFSGPNFHNLAVQIQTYLNKEDIKNNLLLFIEDLVGRIRSDKKFSSRIIDLDCIIFNQEILDENLWTQVYLALPLSELIPGLVNPETGKSLAETAEDLHLRQWAIVHPEIFTQENKKSCKGVQDFPISEV